MSLGSGSTSSNSYGSSNYGAPNYGANFLGSNTLPMNYSNPGFQQPSMSGNGFSWYGGNAQIPEGGTYNQMAQMMAGPSYAPSGSNWYTMPQGVSSNMGGGKGASPYGMGSSMGGGKGASPYGMGSSMGGGKGASPYGFTGAPSAGQPLNSYMAQTLGQTVPSSVYSGGSSSGLPTGWVPGETATSIPGQSSPTSAAAPNAASSSTGLAASLPAPQILSGTLANRLGSIPYGPARYFGGIPVA